MNTDTLPTASSEPTVHPIHTACVGCGFATYENYVTQVGCIAGVLDKYKAQGQVIEAENDTYQFYIINGRTCKYKNVSTGNPFGATQEGAKYVREQLTIDYDLILNILEFNKEKLWRCVESWFKQKKGPRRIIIGNNSLTPTDEVVNEIKAIREKYEFIWKVKTFINDEGLVRWFKWCMNDVKSPMFIATTTGVIPPDNFIYDIDVHINDNLQETSLIMPDTGLPWILGSLMLFRVVKGDDPRMFIERAENYLSNGKKLHTMRNLSQICKTQN